MGKKTKKWISKDKAVTFHLVHRSQQDPLITDENAPQLVMVPDAGGSSGGNKRKKSEKQVEDERKFGIYFDDDYDYLQHLKGEDRHVQWEETTKRPNQKPRTIQLPSSVFASAVEEDVGLLNKAAPESGLRLDLDPDIVAAMDDDFDFDDPENELEDDFIAIANQSGSEDEQEERDSDSFETISEGDEDMDSDFGSDDMEDGDKVGNLHGNFGEVETKSRFTDYSLSSSVIRRNDQLTLLDDHFEKLFEGYDKGEIGALDCEEIEGNLLTTDHRLLELADEHERKRNEKGAVESENMKERVLRLLEHCQDTPEYEEFDIGKGEKWDCESVISTYSNCYNHPAKIGIPKGPKKIRVNKLGVAVEELDGRGGPKLTARNLAALDGEAGNIGPKSIVSMVSELSIRPKGETPEERRIRKGNLREYRHERRIERKANTAAFKDEKKRQEKVLLNLRRNLQGAKIL